MSRSSKTSKISMDVKAIQATLPHRYPFLMLDYVEELVLDSHIIAYKNVSYNEAFFQGHFPNQPIMPGVLTLEAMAQACGVLGSKSLRLKKPSELVSMLVGVDNLRFKSPVLPGHKLKIYVKIIHLRRLSKYDCVASVDDTTVCSGIIRCTYMSEKEMKKKNEEKGL